MQLPSARQKAILHFNSITQLAEYKHASKCDDFYIVRDEFSLVGSFSEEQLQLAKTEYAATYQLID